MISFGFWGFRLLGSGLGLWAYSCFQGLGCVHSLFNVRVT